MAFLAGIGASLGGIAAAVGKGAVVAGKALGKGALALGKAAGVTSEVGAPAAASVQMPAYLQGLSAMSQPGMAGQGLSAMNAAMQGSGQGALSGVMPSAAGVSTTAPPTVTAFDKRKLLGKGLSLLQSGQAGGAEPPPTIQHSQVQPQAGELPFDMRTFTGAQANEAELERLRKRFGGF